MLTFACAFRFGSEFSLDVSFELGQGITLLTGHSGSGKTTVLNLIAGILKPESGRIQLNQHVLVDCDEQVCVRPHRRRVGLVFQDGLLFPHLNVRDNLTYGARRQASSSTNLEQLADKLALTTLLHRMPRTLSGGEARRVAIGRALMSQPDLLMLDEPLAGLDAVRAAETMALIHECATIWEIPVLLVSHEIELARQVSDAAIRLENGRLMDEN
ncbi:MAG: ATP-binding cassette domain-containing protein [Phycisphaerae bacterium]